MTKPYRYIVVPCLVILGICALGFVVSRALAKARHERAEFIAFVQAASGAARTGDVPIMRRLHLEDALLNDTALKRIFADFARLGEAELAKLEPEFEGDTYCWLRLPGTPVMRKLVHTQSGWFLHGDVASVEAR